MNKIYIKTHLKKLPPNCAEIKQDIKTVTEFCPSCEHEAEIVWNTEQDGFKAFCPYCGGRLMLCDECRHRDGEPDCDYNGKTDSCRYNPPKSERAMTNEEKIRTMSREELAEAMAGKIVAPKYCAALRPKCECPEHMDCVRCASEWLDKEVEEE